ncbi:hypothetical protein NpPPO83_00001272 [Neofusicoccum parvum]|uniref:Uncharacterized protein n=1 Tax=Neofusicoccum parvum TaxID=310453 RepID=A0ACB5SNX1_9PEZI|nr:hypothetical protein NpPPO83_00001272 [Neofusicoccum parvum]
MPDQPDDHTASRKRTATPSAPSSPTSPSAENENKRAKLLDPARSPTPNEPTDGTTTTNSADQKPDAGSAAKEAAAAHPTTSEPGDKDTTAAVASQAPVKQVVEPDSTAVAVAANEATADEAVSHSDDAVPESRAFTYRTGVVDCPLSPGEMAELRAYYALDAERRAEERARALAEYDDEDEDEGEGEEGGGRPASSPTAEG